MSGLVKRNRNDRHSSASLSNLLYWKWHLPLMNASCTKAFVPQTWHKLLWNSPEGHVHEIGFHLAEILPWFCFSKETEMFNLNDFYSISNKFFKWEKHLYTSITPRLFHPTIWWDWLWKCLNWLYTYFLIKIIHLCFALVMVKKKLKQLQSLTCRTFATPVNEFIAYFPVYLIFVCLPASVCLSIHLSIY